MLNNKAKFGFSGTFTDSKHLFESSGIIIADFNNSNNEIKDFDDFCIN